MPRDRISHYSIIGKLGEGGMVRDLAQIYSMTGEPEEAIRTIREFLSSLTPHSIEMIRLDPSFDPIRDEPGYLDLLRDCDKTGI